MPGIDKVIIVVEALSRRALFTQSHEMEPLVIDVSRMRREWIGSGR